MIKDVVIVAAKRTAIGKFGGALAKLPASELGAIVMKDLLASVRVNPDQVDEVILGQVLTGGAGQNPARQAAMSAGLPQHVPAMTINKVCGSGLKAVHLAAQAIQAGDADMVIAGGMENMSAAPHVLPHSRDGRRLGDWSLIDTAVHDGLWCAFNAFHMGNTAENLARQYGLTRRMQDAFAVASQRKAAAAQAAGIFDAEIVPVAIPQRKGDPVMFATDEFPRADTTLESLGRLRPAFEQAGTVTAGNASGINDGAAAVLVCAADRAAAWGLPVLATLRGYASAGVDPAIMGIGPVEAVRKTLSKAGWSIDALERIESNEAFAAQALSVNHALGWNSDIINVNGGAIALGHPIGASGCRILVTLLHEMARADVTKGLATLCIGGGQGVALAVERSTDASSTAAR